MKHNNKYNIFGWLAAAALMLTTACSDNIALDTPQGDDNGTKTVTFTIQPQSQELSTRADGDIDTRNKYISDGSKADVLIFAVYKKEADGTWVPDPEFCKGDQTAGLLPDGVLGEAQNAIKVKKYPVTIQLAITDPDAEYKVAFWAQNHETKAYDTKKLHRVKVSYKDADGKLAKNNDELRDAFCVVSDVIKRDTEGKQTVTLRRPLAQVNIGTAGWDYEGAAHLKPSPVSYIYSQVTLGGVAQYYDIINETALNQEALDAEIEANPEDFDEDANADDRKATIDVTFDFNLIPAFVQAEQSEWSTQYTPVDKEEFLQVDVNRDGEINGYTKNKYVGWEDYEKYRKGEYNENAEGYEAPENPDDKTGTQDLFNEGIMPVTEMYKYLSMCYVLVPEAEGETDDDAEGDVAGVAEEEEEEGEATAPQQGNSVLSFVEFKAKGIEISEKDEDADNIADDPTADDAAIDNVPRTVFKINNVPVSKNWRTNIVGNNFFTTITKFHLDIVPEYCGDYNYNGWEYETPDQAGSSWPGEEGKTYTVTFNKENVQSTNNFFTFGEKHSFSGDNKYTGTYNGTSFAYALKMETGTKVEFTVPTRSLVLIAQCTTINGAANNSTIKVDGKELPISSATTPDNSKNVRLYTVSVPAGTHTIIRGSGESGLFSVEVNTSFIIDGETIYPSLFVIEDEDGEPKPEPGGFDDKYPGYKGNGDE